MCNSGIRNARKKRKDFEEKGFLLVDGIISETLLFDVIIFKYSRVLMHVVSLKV